MDLKDETIGKQTLEQIGRAFDLGGWFVEGRPHGNGHINDTFVATYENGGEKKRYLHQRLNTAVFKTPRAVMENVARVCRHLNAIQSHDQRPPGRTFPQTLTLINSVDGTPWWIDDSGDYWRTFMFIERASSLDMLESPEQAWEAARAFGQFQALLTDLPVAELHETIPDFHHTPKRLAALRQAVKADVRGRLPLVRPELDFIFTHEALARSLTDLAATGALPLRVIHNDTKLNNVLFDDQEGTAVCVVDLDTVMPGLSLYDFGDLVRTATSPTAEDESDLSLIHVRPEFFEALTSGFLSSTGHFLTPAERAHLLTAGKLLPLECGIRFLTDFLSGDQYFKVDHPEQNLNRCRAQLQLVRSLTQQEPSLKAMLKRSL